MNVNLEVVSIPVSDVERALEFYRDRLGWRVDADIRGGGDVRVVQMTDWRGPHVDRLRSGIPMAPAGTQRHSELVTSDIVATRRGTGPARRQRHRGLPRPGQPVLPRGTDLRPRPEPGQLQLVRLVRGPGRKRLDPPGDHLTPSGP